MNEMNEAFKKLFGDMYLAESKTAQQIFEYGYKAGLEEAAKVCENLEIPKTIYGAHPDYLTGKHMAVSQCAAAIRERMK